MLIIETVCSSKECRTAGKRRSLDLQITTILVVAVILVAIVILTIFFTTVFVRRREEKRLWDYQDKILKTQRDEVQDLYKTMRGWRHDYHNHMQKIKAHLALNQLEEVKSYLDRLEKDLDEIDVVYKTGNVSVDAILNSKLSVAKKQEIEVNCKATVPKQLSVTDIDLCVILGNLVDNAVESCGKLNEGERRFLRIYIGIFKEQLYISVSNATNEVIRKLDKEFISHKRGNHGHGLKRIDHIVEKYDGFINRKNEPGAFATEIMLPL